MNWFRVPAFLGGRLHGDHVATEAEAWIDILGRWSLGEDVSACAFAEATRWGKGRVLRFMLKAAEWAMANGAVLPKRWTADRNADQDRTAMRTGATKEEPRQSDDSGPVSDRNADQDRTVSRARVPLLEREEDQRDDQDGAPPPAPGADAPTLFGAAPAPSPPEKLGPVARPPKADPVMDLYGAYQRLQPRRSPTPSPDARKAMTRILAEAGTSERAEVYLLWVHTSQDHDARRLRGEVPWPGGERTPRIDPVSLSRNMPPRMDAADAWDRRGRPTIAAVEPVRAASYNPF